MSFSQRDTLRLELPCKTKYLLPVRLAVAGAGDRGGLTVEDIEDLKVAVGEACNNCIEHAFDEEAIRSGTARMRVTIIVGDGEVRVEVEDEGCGFDPKYVTAAIDSDMPSPERLGLYVIKHMTDEMHIQSAPGSGTKVSFVKRRSR
jgi:serine/threonine-protein kinase RsbW